MKIENGVAADWSGMVVGILQIKLMIEWSESLKDECRVVSSLKDCVLCDHSTEILTGG